MDTIEYIKDNSFDSKIFTLTKTLTLNNYNVNNCNRATFKGFESLVAIQFHDFKVSFIPAECTKPMQHLETIAMMQQNSDVLDLHLNNFTSIWPTSKVKHLYLRSLNIKGAINSNVLMGYESLQSLYLLNCKISSIDRSAFVAVRRTIEHISLTGNNLLQLPNGVFSYLLPNPSLRIWLSDNPWFCNCELSELQDYIRKNIHNFRDEINCNSPIESSGYQLATVNLCGEELTADTTIKNIRNIHECLDDQNHSDLLYIQEKHFTFNIIRESNGTVIINIFKEFDNMFIIWLNENRKTSIYAVEEIGCRSNVRHQFEIKELSKNTAYTFCLMGYTDLVVSPFSCFTYWNYDHMKVFLISNMKWFFIISVLLGYLFCFLLGAIFLNISFCYNSKMFHLLGGKCEKPLAEDGSTTR